MSDMVLYGVDVSTDVATVKTLLMEKESAPSWWDRVSQLDLFKQTAPA